MKEYLVVFVLGNMLIKLSLRFFFVGNVHAFVTLYLGRLNILHEVERGKGQGRRKLSFVRANPFPPKIGTFFPLLHIIREKWAGFFFNLSAESKHALIP